ncbi:MAG TPA: glycosyltransferase, partial [Thermoanaerobaculia bacterium]|nr:glycosyltransferase [Thermoanaerobaculia bacterium]
MPSDYVLSVVVPVYRSEAYLKRTVTELADYLRSRIVFEIILVNDGSPDQVGRVMDELCAEFPNVRAITLGRNVGQHRATLFGFGLARGDVVVTVDDDGQNPPEAAFA